MSDNKYFDEFGKPFPASDVGWKLQRTVKDKMRGLAVPYLDARAISDRLDNVVGQNKWKDEYSLWHRYTDNVKLQGKETTKLVNSQLCTIYIYDDEKKEWIGKTDGAENTDFESVKGGLSDAFKRAAVKWNIGRYMYSFEAVWVDLEDEYGKLVIAKHEKANLQKKYYDSVISMFGANAIEAPKSSGNYQKKQEQSNNTKPKEQSKEPQNAKQASSSPVYEIQQINVQDNEKGSVSSFILSCGGNRYSALMKGRDRRLQKGSKITNVKVSKCQSDGKAYNLLSSYDIAA